MSAQILTVTGGWSKSNDDQDKEHGKTDAACQDKDYDEEHLFLETDSTLFMIVCLGFEIISSNF